MGSSAGSAVASTTTGRGWSAGRLSRRISTMTSIWGRRRARGGSAPRAGTPRRHCGRERSRLAATGDGPWPRRPRAGRATARSAGRGPARRPPAAATTRTGTGSAEPAARTPRGSVSSATGRSAAGRRHDAGRTSRCISSSRVFSPGVHHGSRSSRLMSSSAEFSFTLCKIDGRSEITWGRYRLGAARSDRPRGRTRRKQGSRQATPARSSRRARA